MISKYIGLTTTRIATKQLFGGLTLPNRTYLTNNQIEIDQQSGVGTDQDVPSHSIESMADVNKYISQLSLNNPTTSENIRIPYFTLERELKEIKGIKLYGHNEDRFWMVISGGKNPGSFSTVELALCLGTVCARYPINNVDVLIFPVQNPSIYLDGHQQPRQFSNLSTVDSNNTNSNTNNQFNTKKKQSNHTDNGGPLTLESLLSMNNFNIPTTAPTNGKSKTVTSPLLLNKYSSSNNEAITSKKNKSDYTSGSKSNVYFRDWLRSSRREFNYLDLTISPHDGKPSVNTISNNNSSSNSNSSNHPYNHPFSNGSNSLSTLSFTTNDFILGNQSIGIKNLSSPLTNDGILGTQDRIKPEKSYVLEIPSNIPELDTLSPSQIYQLALKIRDSINLFFFRINN